jgi:hypothetical protein
MFGLFDFIKFGAGAVVGALAAYWIGHAAGESAGYARRISEMAIADGKATMERKGDDAALQNMSDYDLCLVGLRGAACQSTPVSSCGPFVMNNLNRPAPWLSSWPTGLATSACLATIAPAPLRVLGMTRESMPSARCALKNS